MNPFGKLMHLNERSCKLRELHICKLRLSQSGQLSPSIF